MPEHPRAASLDPSTWVFLVVSVRETSCKSHYVIHVLVQNSSVVVITKFYVYYMTCRDFVIWPLSHHCHPQTLCCRNLWLFAVSKAQPAFVVPSLHLLFFSLKYSTGLICQKNLSLLSSLRLMSSVLWHSTLLLQINLIFFYHFSTSSCISYSLSVSFLFAYIPTKVQTF